MEGSMHHKFFLNADSPCGLNGIIFLGSESKEMKDVGLSFVFPQNNICVKTREIVVKNRQHFGISIYPCDGSNAQDCIYLGKCWVDEDQFSHLIDISNLMVPQYGNTSLVCPFCASTASSNGAAFYYIVATPAFCHRHVAKKTESQSSWEISMVPRLTCVDCLRRALIVNQPAQKNIWADRFEANDIHQINAVPHYPLSSPLGTPSIHVFSSLKPSYPYLGDSTEQLKTERKEIVAKTSILSATTLLGYLIQNGVVDDVTAEARVVFWQMLASIPGLGLTPRQQTKYKKDGTSEVKYTFLIERCGYCSKKVDAIRNDASLDGRTCTFLRCRKCKAVTYCDQSCYKKHYHDHKEQCQVNQEKNKEKAKKKQEKEEWKRNNNKTSVV